MTRQLMFVFALFIVFLFTLNFLQNNKDNKEYEGLFTEKKYCVWYNFTTAKSLKHVRKHNYEPITLAVHSTSNFAHHIIKQSKNWDDFISYAILLPEMRTDQIYHLQKLHHCFSSIRKKVSFHLVWFDSTMKCDRSTKIDKRALKCSDLNATLTSLQNEDLSAFAWPYPINLLRFIARKGAATNIHIVADIENIFSKNFAKIVRNETQKLLLPEHEKELLVYRRFEFDPKFGFAENMMDTYWMHQGGLMYQFHHFIFASGHTISNLTEWMTNSIFESNEFQLTDLPYNQSIFEPQFIMNGNAPYHLINVPTRIVDHQILVNELCRANYTFKLLPHVYNAHEGIKYSVPADTVKISERNMPKGSQFFKEFNAYLDQKYPETKERCPALVSWN